MNRTAASARVTLSAFELGGAVPTVLSLLTATALWEFSSRQLHYPFMPPLARILRSALELTSSGEMQEALAASAGVLVAGYLLAAVSGVAIGVLIGRFQSVAIACEPYVNALLAVPSLLLVPIFFGVFGLGRATAVAVVFVYSFPVIALMTGQAIKRVDGSLVEMVRVFGASEDQIIRHVLLPGALPAVMAGLRLGIGRAIRSVINAEMLLGVAGVGGLLRRYGNLFDASRVFGILAVLVIASLIINGLFRLIDARVNRWMAE